MLELAMLSSAGPPLHDFVDRALQTIPLEWARWAFVLLFALPAIWAARLPREYIYLGAPDRSRWRDLRLWVVLFLVPYVIVYLSL